MILNEEIIKLAEEYLEEWEADDQDGNTWMEYSGTTKDIIDFAQKIYEMGYNEGGYDTSIVMGDQNV